MVRVLLKELAHARSGDKGDTSNIGIIAYNPKHYAVIGREVTAARVKEHLAEFVKGEVRRYELPNLAAYNFVCRQALDGGGSRSLRSDNLGKCFGAMLLRLEIEVAPEEI